MAEFIFKIIPVGNKFIKNAHSFVVSTHELSSIKVMTMNSSFWLLCELNYRDLEIGFELLKAPPKARFSLFLSISNFHQFFHAAQRQKRKRLFLCSTLSNAKNLISFFAALSFNLQSRGIKIAFCVFIQDRMHFAFGNYSIDRLRGLLSFAKPFSLHSKIYANANICKFAARETFLKFCKKIFLLHFHLLRVF